MSIYLITANVAGAVYILHIAFKCQIKLIHFQIKIT
jgi:hypothetical protein